MELAESSLQALWPPGANAVATQSALDNIQTVCQSVTNVVATALSSQCAVEDANKITVPPFTTYGLIFMFASFLASCLYASLVSLLVQRYPRKAYLLIWTPVVDWIELLGTSFILNTFTEPGCTATKLIQTYLIIMAAGCVTDLAFFVGWFWGRSLVDEKERATGKGIAIMSVLAWSVFFFISFVLYFAIRMSVGYSFGFGPHDGVVNMTPGIVLGISVFILGTMNTASILMLDSAPPEAPPVPKSWSNIFINSWQSIVIWIWLVNGSIVFSSSIVAAYASPIAAGIITGAPSGVWSALIVLEKQRVPGDTGSKFLVTCPIYGLMSVIALLLYANDYGISLIWASLVGLFVSAAVAVGYYFFTQQRQTSDYRLLKKSQGAINNVGAAAELLEQSGKTASYLRVLTNDG